MSTAQERHPHVYVSKDEDPHTRKRTVPLEVISCGYSRTGTMTMKSAFETLGLPCWHWVHMSENPPDIGMWTEGLRAKFDPDSGVAPFGRAEFDGLLSRWGATTDQPAAIFCEELLQAYPDLKVVLVERDVDRWYKSFCDTVIAGAQNPFIPLGSLIDPVFLRRTCEQTDVLMKYYFNIDKPREKWLMNNPAAFEAYRANAKATYLAHNEMVKRVTPKDRLLVFKLEEGWKPLCSFLGKPVPDVPFPRVNETKAVQELIELYVSQSYKRSLIGFAKRSLPVAAVFVAGLAWWVLR